MLLPNHFNTTIYDSVNNMRKTKEQLSKQDEKETLTRLYTAASAIKNKNQMEQFLREILTESEQLMIGRRIWIAQLLLTGHTHDEIGERLHAGPQTIRRVSKWLNEKLPGYGEAVIQKKRKKKGEHYERVDPLSFKALRKRYGMHFLLFNIVETLLQDEKK
jgi:uncharacterized protein YerC